MPSDLFTAIGFLTRFPVPSARRFEPEAPATWALYFPLVGLLIGGGLWGIAALLQAAPAPAAASILLVAWVLATGGLHLDGLADSADAWVGGIGDRERTLDIMKDPAIGAIGATALVLVLIAKWSALASLVDGNAMILLWLPTLARAQLLLVFLTTPYVGRGGIGGHLAGQLPRRLAWAVLVAVWLGCLLALGAEVGTPMLAAMALFAVWRHATRKRLGGFTGDAAGALVELTETAMLLAFAAVGT